MKVIMKLHLAILFILLLGSQTKYGLESIAINGYLRIQKMGTMMFTSTWSIEELSYD